MLESPARGKQPIDTDASLILEMNWEGEPGNNHNVHSAEGPTDEDLMANTTSGQALSTDIDSDDNFESTPIGSQVHDSCEVGVGPELDVPDGNSFAAVAPFIGMEFGNEEEAYNCYNFYAKEKGFSIRKGRVERSRADRRVLSRSYVCSNEGKKYTKDKRRTGMDYQPRASKKTECRASMRVKADGGKWVVDILVLEHNHPLVDPAQSFRLRSHQKASKSTVQMIERLQRCGVAPSLIFTILKEFAGGEEHTGISDVRFRSIFRAKRRKSLGVDCQLAVNYLETKRASDPNFFYSISVNKDQELTGIFWVDGRAREQYQSFGDVIVFDTTYRKNKYKFPFAPFTGVNHHMQCILFGCGLIADETKESFEWLFTTWVRAMQNVHPKAILTDEDPGIMRAVRKVFPSTVHRLCAWHLEKHRQTHLGPLFRKYPDFKHMFYRCVHMSTTPIEFEISWADMINSFSLQNHKWLKKKFKIRKHWVPCYFGDTFFAGMTTTQRAESMNNYFKGYFSSSTPISEFITQYEEAVGKRRSLESKADVICLTSTPTCSTTHPLELHAAQVYTHNVFNIFKEEWKTCLGVEIRECVTQAPFNRYETVYPDGAQRNDLQVVVDSVETGETTCTCKFFEHTGVLCKHILKVFVVTDRRRIPDMYVLSRLTKAARYTSTDDGPNVGAPAGMTQQPVWVLHDLANRLVSEGSLSLERFGVTYQGLTYLLNDVLKMAASQPVITSEFGEHVNDSSSTINAQRAVDPTTQSVTRGRPNQTRICSTYENYHQRRSYHCSACGQSGHNVVKCPKVKGGFGGVTNSSQRQPMHVDLNAQPIEDPE